MTDAGISGGRKWVIFLAIAVFIAVADQISKGLVIAGIPLNTAKEIWPGFLDLVHVRNPGAAFGVFSRANWDYRSLFFISVSFVAVMALVWIVAGSRDIRWSLLAAYGLFLGGAVGNLVDRLRFGEVIDFLDVHWGDLHWPAFNVADSALCVAVALFALHLLTEKEPPQG